MKWNICMIISLDPSFCGGGNGSCGTGTPRKLQHTAAVVSCYPDRLTESSRTSTATGLTCQAFPNN